MIVINEKGLPVSYEEMKNDILSDLDTLKVPDEHTLEADLESYYEEQFSFHNSELGLSPMALSAKGIGPAILKKVKAIVCKVIDEDSTAGEIVEAVMDAIVSIIPGGKLIKFIVGQIVKLLLSQGRNRFCETV